MLIGLAGLWLFVICSIPDCCVWLVDVEVVLLVEPSIICICVVVLQCYWVWSMVSAD